MYRVRQRDSSEIERFAQIAQAKTLRPFRAICSDSSERSEKPSRTLIKFYAHFVAIWYAATPTNER